MVVVVVVVVMMMMMMMMMMIVVVMLFMPHAAADSQGVIIHRRLQVIHALPWQLQQRPDGCNRAIFVIERNSILEHNEFLPRCDAAQHLAAAAARACKVTATV